MRLGVNIDVVGGCPNENLGAGGADDVGSVATDDAPENEKRGIGVELSGEVVAVVETRAGASALATAGVEPRIMGEAEFEAAPKFGA